MAKYLRLKTDGFIYDFNEKLVETDRFDVVDIDGTPPERIADSPDAEHNKPPKATRRKQAATEAE